jgi:transcriptional regulator GlxA family with amidase domain
MQTVGILIFPAVEELDFIGPFEVLNYINKIQPGGLRVLLVAETLAPVQAFNGLRVLPDVTCQNCPPLDILLVPGGKGRIAAMKNQVLLHFIQVQSTTARYITSVCTGAFLLASAGLLTNKKATTYHTAFEELATFGVDVQSAKVVRDGNIITAAGVSSGLELGFYLIRELFGLAAAQETAQKIEYAVDVAAL